MIYSSFFSFSIDYFDMELVMKSKEIFLIILDNQTKHFFCFEFVDIILLLRQVNTADLAD